MKSTSSTVFVSLTIVAASLLFGCGGGTPIKFPPPHMSSFTWVRDTSDLFARHFGTRHSDCLGNRKRH